MADPFDMNNAMTDATETPEAPAPAVTSFDEPRVKTLNKANMVLAALFAGGIAALWMLSLRNGPQQASAQQQTVELQVNAALTQFSAAAGGKKTSSVVDTFYYEAKQRQVPLEAIQTNPFIYVPPAAEQGSGDGAASIVQTPAADAAEQQTKAKAMEAVRKLQLQSVLMGSRGVTAMISNNLLTEGQTINGWTVKSIEPRMVVLTWNDQQYTLEMPK